MRVAVTQFNFIPFTHWINDSLQCFKAVINRKNVIFAVGYCCQLWRNEKSWKMCFYTFVLTLYNSCWKVKNFGELPTMKGRIILSHYLGFIKVLHSNTVHRSSQLTWATGLPFDHIKERVQKDVLVCIYSITVSTCEISNYANVI